MKRPGYREAIDWIAANDDTEWVEYSLTDAGSSVSVTGALTCDLFGVDVARLRKDVRKALGTYHTRVVDAPAYEGKPTWHGEYYFGSHWVKVESAVGPLAYASKEAASNGAKLMLSRAFEEIDNGKA